MREVGFTETYVEQVDRHRVEEVYRDAYEQARAVLRPPVTERLAPIWN